MADERRQAILEISGEVFAEQGFEKATVREICERAKANVAAINYYFGDKQTLYKEALEFAQCCQIPLVPELSDPHVPKRQRLEGFIHGFMAQLLDEGRPSWHSKLMAREMLNPTPALDFLVNQYIRSSFNVMLAIVADYLGPQASQEEMETHVCSIIGQCLFYRHCQPVIERMSPAMKYTPETIQRLSAHVSAFSHDALIRAAQRFNSTSGRKG